MSWQYHRLQMAYRPPRMQLVNFRLDAERIRALDAEARQRRISVPFGRDLRGVYRGGELWAFTETVKRIAEEVQCSLTTVLRELEGQGLHVVKTGSRGRVERATVNDARVDAYVFTPRDGDAPGTGQVAQAEVDHAVDRVASFA